MAKCENQYIEIRWPDKISGIKYRYGAGRAMSHQIVILRPLGVKYITYSVFF
jgi:hypothetical protein